MHRSKRKGKDKILHATGMWNQSGIAILFSDKEDFKLELIRIKVKGCYILLKRTLQWKR